MKKLAQISFMLVLTAACSGYSQNLANREISKQVTVQVVIPKISKLLLLDGIDGIDVTTQDIAKGYVDIPNAIKLKLWSNNQGGSVVETQLESELCNAAGEVFPKELLMYRLAGDSDFISFGGCTQMLATCPKAENGKILSVDLRLIVPANMKPGSYSCLASFNLASI
jgi:uncharacterized ParB-like nuclease family protein